jgi:hypothetical protein
MDVTNDAKEKLLRAMLDYVIAPDGNNGLSRLLAQPMSQPERDDLVHEAINIMNEMTAFVQMMKAKKPV